MALREGAAVTPSDRPWFRRWVGFSFIAITWQGWLATAACLTLGAASAYLSLVTGDNLSRAYGIAFIAVATGFCALVFWKMESRLD